MIAFFRSGHDSRDGKPAAAPQAGRCGACRYFGNDPQNLEAALPGLTSLSSAYGATRADDGICRRHDRLVRANFGCGDFACPDRKSTALPL